MLSRSCLCKSCWDLLIAPWVLAKITHLVCAKKKWLKNELAHSLTIFNTWYKDTGLFGVYVVCPDIKVDDCVWTLMNNLIRLVHIPSDAEVERDKLNLKATMLMGLDGHSNVAEDFLRMTVVDLWTSHDTSRNLLPE
jgi:predicted Zn-dependent peptidase